MSIELALVACEPGTYDWVVKQGVLGSPDDLFPYERRSECIRGFPSAMNLYARLVGDAILPEDARNFWGAPSNDRYKIALIGGNLIVDTESYLGPMRCSTAEQAREAWVTVEEVVSIGTPSVTPETLREQWPHAVETYLAFYRALQEGEEVFCYRY